MDRSPVMERWSLAELSKKERKGGTDGAAKREGEAARDPGR